MKKYKNFNYACKGNKNMGILRLKKLYLGFQKFKSIKESFLIWKDNIKNDMFIFELGSYFKRINTKSNKLIFEANAKDSLRFRKKIHCRGYPYIII